MTAAETPPAPEPAGSHAAAPPDLPAQLAGYGVAPRPPAGWLADVAWADLQLALRSQLLPFLAAALHDGERHLTDDERAELTEVVTTRFHEAVALEQELVRLTDVLGDHGVGLRVLKGAAHAHLDYPDPALRLFGDTDLLVAAADIELAKTALEARGYRRLRPERRDGYDVRFEKSLTLLSPDGMELDLHRTFISGPLGHCFDPSELFETAETFELGGRRLPALGREERLIHACISATISDPDPRLRPARDVVQMLVHPALDADRVVRLAHRWQLAAVLALGIRGADERLGTRLATPLVEWARGLRPGRRDRWRLEAYVGARRSYVRRTLAALATIPGAQSRAAYAVALVRPDTDAVPAPLGDRIRRGVRTVLSRRT